MKKVKHRNKGPQAMGMEVPVAQDQMGKFADYMR